MPVVKKILKLKSKLNLQIIIVDDGSNDGTDNRIKKFLYNKVDKVIFKKKNSGKGSCIIAAKKFCSGDFIIIQDADLEYDPNDYLLFKQFLQKNKVDAIYGSRFLKKSFSENINNFTGIYRVFGNKLLTFISNLINFQNLTDAHTCYKVFSKKLFFTLNLQEKGFSFCPEVNTKISNLNLKIHEVPISYHGRGYESGKKIKYIDFFYAIKTIIKYKLFS